MATYQITEYGTDVYGSRPLVELDASPVLATPTSSGIMTITWAIPGGTWTQISVVKSASGYPVTRDDGELLYDSTYPGGSVTDTKVAAGHWYYYAVFVLVGTDWLLAGQASGLSVGDRGSAAWLEDLVPAHLKFTGDELSSLTSSEPNTSLMKFLSVFAWGMDNLRSYGDRLLELNDPTKTHESNIEQLAKQLGVRVERTMPASLQRLAVENATYLHQRAGTVQGLRDLINVSTGLDADIRIGPNMLLSDDQAEFAHPAPPAWDAGLRYHQFEKVIYSNHVYECRITGTAGDAQKPNGAPATNTWWTHHSVFWNDWDARNTETNGQYSWMAVRLSDSNMVNLNYLGLSQGVPAVGDLTNTSNTALAIWNRDVTTQSFDLRSVSRLIGNEAINFVEPMQNVKDAVPLPKVHKTWDSATTFLPGDLVRYNGLVFQALYKVIGGTAPGEENTLHPPTAWRNVGVDERYGITLSLYAHQSFESGDPTCAVWPHVGFFDENGTYFTTLYASGTDTLAIDTFGFPGKTYPSTTDPDVNGRTMERFPAYVWTVNTGAWVRDPYLGGVARPVDPTVKSIATVAGTANMQVGMTPRTDTATGHFRCIMFRYSDANNYWQARRTGLYKTVAGVTSLVGTYSQAAENNDRLVVQFNGSAIKVFRNGPQVLSVTDSFNSSAIRHGMGNI